MEQIAGPGAGGKAQWVRTLTALAEDQDSVPPLTGQPTITYTFSSRGPPSDPHRHQHKRSPKVTRHTHIHRNKYYF